MILSIIPPLFGAPSKILSKIILTKSVFANRHCTNKCMDLGEALRKYPLQYVKKCGLRSKSAKKEGIHPLCVYLS
jgi:hypothetical protein